LTPSDSDLDPQADASPSEVPPKRGLGPVVLLLPLIAVVAGLMWEPGGGGRGEGPRPVPPKSERDLEVPGWVGETEIVPGARLAARLVPLHTADARQRFDRDALAAKLGLGEGQPWQLVLTYRGPLAGSQGPSAPVLDLDRLAVRGDGAAGLDLAVPVAPRVDPDGLADPLLALLAPPAQLSPGRQVTLVLWGPPPIGSPRLVLGSAEFSLRAATVPAQGLPRSLARLEREVPR
jgi:hypothetical protein